MIALDIEGISTHVKGQSIVNALLRGGSEMYRTARGRLAILMRLDLFEKQKRIHNLTITEGLDGLQDVSFA